MKTAVQRNVEVHSLSGSLAAGGTFSSASIECAGFARLTGILLSSTSSAAGSGLIVRQSTNLGSSWSYITACGIATCSACDSAFSIEIVGNAVRVEYVNGDDDAASLWSFWQIRPI